MNRNVHKYLVPAVFAGTALLVGVLFFFPVPFFDVLPEQQGKQTKVVTPQTPLQGLASTGDSAAESMAYEDATVSKIALNEGETAVYVLTQDLDGDPQDEQIIAFKSNGDADEAVKLAYIDFSETEGAYRKVWEATTPLTKPRTLSLFVKDLVGDRSICVVVSGMNDAGEQTLSAYHKTGSIAPRSGTDTAEPFRKIIELSIDGSIAIQESDRSQAYELGLTGGKSFTISSYGRDYESANILDQIETSYAYDPLSGRYERSGTARIAGIQIEQRKVKELLDGTPAKFESFIEGLWYYISPDGTESPRQYLYFDPEKREIIFYSDDTQEVYLWQNSSATRYGIYITSQNISVTTLRRLIDIELESIDGIRLKIFEDVKLKIGVSGRWDGSYRKGQEKNREPAKKQALAPWIEADYEGAQGKISFKNDGTFAMGGLETGKSGRYAFFRLDELEMLELRSPGAGDAAAKNSRETYRVERTATGAGEQITLTKVRIGVDGLDDLHEGSLSLFLVKKGETPQIPRP